MIQAGAMLVAASNDAVFLFVGLELVSIPTYLLLYLSRRTTTTQEAATKYFYLSVFSSGLLLYGLTFLYGLAGITNLKTLALLARDLPNFPNMTLGLVAVVFIMAGLCFRAAAVPLHFYAPDVYQGSPTPITALMASCTLVAAFGALLRVFYVAFGQLTWDWRPAMWAVAILTMLVGSIIAITQTDMKRLLAYSSIAQAGYILTGVIAANAAGLSGSMFYLLAYGFATIGGFAIVTLVRDRGGLRATGVVQTGVFVFAETGGGVAVTNHVDAGHELLLTTP